MNLLPKRIIDFLASEKTAERVAIAVFIVILALISFGQVSYNDFWWHLALGKWMLATNSFLTHDIFSLAFSGKLWLNNTWIFDTLLYFIYSRWSFIGLGAFRFFVFGVGYWLILKVARIEKNSTLLFGLAVTLCSFLILRNFLRPEITSALFVGSFLYILYTYQQGNSRLLYALPFIEILWVNTHGSFMLGIALIGIFLVSELIRTCVQHQANIIRGLGNHKLWILTFIASLSALATLINPIGYKIHSLVSAMLADKETLANVQEWNPLPLDYFFTLPFNQNTPLVLFTWLFVVLCVFQILELWKNRHSILTHLQNIRYEDYLIFLMFLLSAIQYVRGLPMLALITSILLIRNAPRIPVIRNMCANTTHGLALFLLVLSYLVYSNVDSLRLNPGPSPFQHLRESLDYVKKNNLAGNYLNEYAAGGELIWKLYPKYKVFMDGRAANVYDASYFWYYRNLSDERVFKKAISQYDINFAVVHHDWAMGNILRKKDDWKLVFFDNAASIYVRATNDTASLLQRDAYTVLNPTKSPDEYVSLCSDPTQMNVLIKELQRNVLELQLPVYSMQVFSKLALKCALGQEHLQRAESMYEYIVYIQPKNISNYYDLATIELALDKSDDALFHFKQALRLGKNKEIMTGYGIALHNLGEYHKAEKAFEKALDYPGAFPKEYYQIYGRTLYQLDDNARAIDMLNRYIDLIAEDEITAQDYLDLSHAYNDNGQADTAAEYLQKAQTLEASKQKSS